jgi:hypothetical protein
MFDKTIKKYESGKFFLTINSNLFNKLALGLSALKLLI